MDNVQHPRDPKRATGDASGIEVGRSSPVCRAWAGAGGACALVAGHLTPVWKRLSGGCHLNRAIEELIESAGFRIERLDKGYMQGPKPMTFTYEGSARRG